MEFHIGTKKPNKKTLVSFQLSTLILILLAIVVMVIVISNIKKRVSSVAKENEDVKEIAVSDSFSRDAEVTSRSLDESRREDAQEDAANENEEVADTNIPIEQVTTQGENLRSIEIDAEVIEEDNNEELPTEEIAPSTPIDQVKISIDMDLTVRTGLSREDFMALMANMSEDTSGFFEENAGLIYDKCEKYSLNEIFFVGLISAESGWNIAGNHRRTHNYISLMSGNGLIQFSSVEDGLEKAAKTLHDRYLTPGGSFYYGKTLAAMRTKFCPVNSGWTNLVYGRMSQVLN